MTTTNEMQNITWAMTMVPKPRLTPRLRNRASSEAPSTTSGVAIGRKMVRFVAVRPRNRCRASAKAIIVPRTVATSVARTPIFRLFARAGQTSGAPHGFFHLSRVKPFQEMFDLPESLNENANV